MSALQYRIFLPPNLATQGALPLLVALHGCNQTASDFATGSRFDEVAARYGAIVVYPEQTRAANKMGCWNWFLREHQSRGSGEPAAILRIVKEVKQRHAIDPGRVFVAGISAGGAMPSGLPGSAGMVALKGMKSPKLHALVEKLSVGLAPVLQPSSRPRSFGTVTPPEVPHHAPAGSYARMRVMLWTGTADTTVAPTNSEALARQFATLLDLEQEPSQRDGRSGGIQTERWRDASGRARVERRPFRRFVYTPAGTRREHGDVRVFSAITDVFRQPQHRHALQRHGACVYSGHA
jgi:poly(hydroxyalkanoate) depolymerase family esterase